MSHDGSDHEVAQQHVPEEEPTGPSQCVLAQETTHGSSSSNLDLQMKLMENSLGSVELLDRDKPAKYIVAEAINELDCHLHHLAGKKTSIFIPIIKTGLSNYCTLQEMQTLMLRTVEHYFTNLFADDKLGRQVYMVRSLYGETVRRHEAEQEATSNKAVAVAGIHAREKLAAAEPVKGDDPVAEIIKGLECDLNALTNQKIQVIFQSLKTCLSEYYTLEEMQRHMSAAVEQYYTSLFVDDELGRQAYLEKSLRRETARRHEAEEAASKVQPPQGRLSQSDEEAMAYQLVSSVIKDLEGYIEITDEQKSRKMMECMITCLSSYYTMEEMQTYMSSMTTLKAPAVEKWYTRELAQKDEAAHEAYVAVSRRMEAIRATQNQTSDSQGSTESPAEASTSYSAGKSTRSGSKKNSTRRHRN